MTMKIKCPVCGNYGVMITKTTITKISGREYRYEKWYVYHNRSKRTKQRWCYLSKKYSELPEIKEAIEKQSATQNNPIATQNTTQINTQNNSQLNNPDLGLFDQNKGYINSMLTKTSSGTRILIIRLITRSSASMSMRRLWMRSSHLSQVAVPSPHGVFRTGTRSLLVGSGIGPDIFTPVFVAMVLSSPHTSSSFW